MTTHTTTQRQRTKPRRMIRAFMSLAVATCALSTGAYAQTRPFIAWSSDRANRQRLDPAKRHHDIYVMDNLGQDVRRITDAPGDEGYPSWSPNGKRIAFTHQALGRTSISIMDSNGGNWSPLTQHPAGGGMPAWSPNGEQIAFVSQRGPGADVWSADIYVVNVDGSGLRNLTQHKAHDWYPAWSPDGSQLAFASNRQTGGTKYHIHLMDADGGAAQLLTDVKWDGLAPTWSPDGSEIAYWGRGVGDATLIVPAAGGQPRRMSETVEDTDHPAWSPDGRQIAYEKRGTSGCSTSTRRKLRISPAPTGHPTATRNGSIRPLLA